MKTLAELLIELAKIPNPEKVGIAFLNRDDEFELMPNHHGMSRTSPITTLAYPFEQDKAKAQGLDRVLTF